MSIRIIRNDAGNCINFQGSSQPAYWNACLSAELNEEDNTRINVINDIQTGTDLENPVYEFYAIPYTRFLERDGTPFSTAQDAVNYINENANVTGGGTHIVATAEDVFNFSRDATNTTVLIDNGDDHAVNSIKASQQDNGLISISEYTDSGAVIYEDVYPANVSITGTPAGTNVSSVVNQLNALFSVTPLGVGGIDLSGTIPTSDAVSITTNKQEGNDPIGADIYTTGGDTSTGHGARVWSDEVIDQRGEYFQVKISGGGRFILGLVDANNATDMAELTNNSGNGHSGLQWGNAFYDYGSYTAPWTTYGTNSSLVYGPGWTGSGNDKMMRYNQDVQDAIQVNFTGGLFRVGITDSGYFAVWYYDAGRSNDWIITARSGYVASESEYKLVVKLWDQNISLKEEPKIYRLASNPVPLTINTLDSAGTLNLLGTATLGVDSDTISVQDGQKDHHNDGFYSSGSISQPGEFFEIRQRIGQWNLGIYNKDSGFDVSTLDDSTGYTYNTAYYFGSRIGSDGDFITTSLRRDADLDGAGVTNTFYDNVNDVHTRMRIGFDLSGKATLWVADSDKDNSNYSIVHQYQAVAPAAEYALLAKAAGSGVSQIRASRISIGQLDAAPVVNFRYIESPDGSFYYPLFASATEANYVAQNIESLFPAGGYTNTDSADASHTHVFIDDQSNTMWYMPNNVAVEADSAAPSWAGISFTSIPTAADENYAPAAFSGNDQVWPENYSVNLQLLPQDVNWTQTVTGFPPELSYNSLTGLLTGNLTYVSEDTTYTVTVTRSNAYGSSVGTFDITIQDNASLGDLADFTELAGNFVQPNRAVLSEDFVMKYDYTLSPGEELTYTINTSSGISGLGHNPPTIGILSTLGDSAFDHYDSAGVALGSTGYDFAEGSMWDLRVRTEFTNINSMVGFSDNTYISGTTGENVGPQFKLEYDSADGYMRLYRGSSLLKTSASTFTGAQTITLAGFEDQVQTDLFVPNDLTIQNSSYGSTQTPSGFDTPLLQGSMETSTLMGTDSDEDAVAQLSQALPVNHRMIFPQTWTEANVLPYTASGVSNKAFIGVPDSAADFTDVSEDDFNAYFKIQGTSSIGSYQSRINSGSFNTTSDATSTEDGVTVHSLTDAFFDYALEWDGDDLHVIACNVGDINTQPAINAGGSFFRSVTETGYSGTGDLDVVIGVDEGAQVNLSTSGISVIRTPFGANDILVGEASNGHGRYEQQPAASVYDAHVSGHAPASMTWNAISTLNAGTTYRFIYHPSMEADDRIEFRLASDNTTVYTTGITTFGSGDPSFTGEYKGIEFAVPADAPPLKLYYYNGHSGGAYHPTLGLPISISGSTYVAPVTGITQEGPSGNQTGNNLFNDPVDDADGVVWGWLSIDEQLSAGERLVLDNAFLVDLTNEMPNNSAIFIGLKSNSWSENYRNNSIANATFAGARFAIYRYSASDIRVFGYITGGTTIGQNFGTNGILNSNVELAMDLTSSGNNIRLMMGSSSNSSDDVNSTAYADWNSSYKTQTGDQGYGLTSVDVMILGDANVTGSGGSAADDEFDTANVDWTGISEISVPTPASTLTTNWDKALDFSGSSERTQQVANDSNRCPIMMGGVSTTVTGSATAGKTTAHSSGRPWATAVVFSSDNNSSNQHIWNLGEGAGSTDDNIYLRVDANRNLYFGWGRSGALNECELGTLSSGSGNWYGIYIAHTGERLSGTDATAANLADCFDIRGINLSTGVVGSNMSTSTNWTSTGGRMDRQILGQMTIGGRGANRNFHGQVAAMVVTTLSLNVNMPGTSEISMMVRDPMQWLTDYKVGNYFRLPWQGTNSGFNFSLNDGSSSYATQVWLMGDGTNDAYSQIRNQVWPATQNYTPMNMVSMVSNDIVTVNINGLT